MHVVYAFAVCIEIFGLQNLLALLFFPIFGHLSKTLVKLDGQSFVIEFNFHLVFVAMETFLGPAEAQLSTMQANKIRHYADPI